MLKIELGPSLSRRRLLAGAGAAVLIGLLPRGSWANPEDVNAAMKKLVPNFASAKEGKFTLNVPQIAENGATVPITVGVASPMTGADYVKALHIFADNNPFPDVASFFFSPASGKAEISTRIRLAKTQNVIFLAETSGGEVYSAKQEVRVTVGGCGG